MNRIALVLMMASVCSTRAAEQAGPACPQGTRPRFTGHPFRVWVCPPKDQPASNPPPAAPALNRTDKRASDVRDVVGKWKGIVNYGGLRYEVRLDARKKGRGVEGEWSAMEYHTHIARALKGRLSPLFFDRGHLRGAVEAEHFEPLVVEAFAGKTSSSTAEGYEHAVVWTLEGLKDRHELFYTQAGGALRYMYRWFAENGPGPVGSVGELRRED